ncbi:molybdopterin-guanine dinucleotide biosynthesis protein B [uncultured Endozoicomonas sp.]|uniref:molybdopterin-guanine dinucleotide biosynthesis protein B n=1 Tax=uncultured Endozoicomonas sp. TaxID=432652 RepID=UPI002603E8E0|nr:molybdopterin-guanine dinucleotide biosynthesis protein B [uncultured Endozoicomonas sp.]
MIKLTIPVLGIAAHSGTGKTTLIEQLIPILMNSGFRIGMVKASHHTIEPDPPGKDSFRLRQAGAHQLVLSTPGRSICYTEYAQGHERCLEEQLNLLDHDALNLIIVEGFREAPIPKIELHRSDYDKPYLFPSDPNIIAIAWDINDGITLPSTITELDINNPANIAAFIEQFCHAFNGSAFNGSVFNNNAYKNPNEDHYE